MKTTVLAVDVVGFINETNGFNSRRVANYLVKYYQCVARVGGQFGFTVIKTVGDCVLLNANGVGKDTDKAIKKLYDEVSKMHKIEVVYRRCNLAPVKIKLDGYRCDDLFGRDFHLLFTKDLGNCVIC